MPTPSRAMALSGALLLACAAPAEHKAQGGPLITAPPILASSWPTFQGSNTHTGAFAVEPILKPSIAWRARVGVQSWLNNPILVAEMVITGSSGQTWNQPDNMDGVVALDAATGKRRWFAPAKADVNGISYGMGVIVATGDEGAAWGIDAASGKQLWHTPSRTGAKLYAHPLILPGIAVVADARGDLDALDLRTGQRRWSVALKEEVRAALASDGQTIYVATTQGSIHAIDLHGKTRWSARPAHELPSNPDAQENLPIPPAFWAPLTLSGDLLIAAYVRDTTYGSPALMALHRATGHYAWLAPTPRDLPPEANSWGNLRASPIISQNNLYWPEPYSRDIASAQLSDGALRFRSSLGACAFPQWASPAASSDLIYTPRMDGTLWATSHGYGLVEWYVYLGDGARAGQPYPDDLKARAKSGHCDWELPDIHGLYASPTLAPDGSIFQGSGDGLLYKIVDITPRESPERASNLAHQMIGHSA